MKYWNFGRIRTGKLAKMLGQLKKTISETKFRIKLRNSLQQETNECLYITLQEVKKEIERRNRKNVK